MAITRLNQELLPYFVYLLDQIKDDEGNFIDVGAIFDFMKDNDISCSWHAIRNAFVLRKELGRKTPSGKPIHLTSKNTLDALTVYWFGTGYIFKDLVNNTNDIGIPNSEVKAHYKKAGLNLPMVAKIFGHKYEKERFLEMRKEILEDFREEFVSKSSLDEILVKLNIETEKKFTRYRKKVNDDLRLREDLIVELQVQIDELKKKSRWTTVLRGIFGTLGAFIVAIDYNEDVIGGFFQEFLTIKGEIIDDDEFLDDLV